MEIDRLEKRLHNLKCSFDTLSHLNVPENLNKEILQIITKEMRETMAKIQTLIGDKGNTVHKMS
jgi:archaellum component FlaC